MNNIDVDEAIGYVDKIIDNVRCGTCDRLQGSRLRYPCGHTACDECIIYAEECQICSPPSQHTEPTPDNALTLAVKNATELLNASRNLLNVNALQNKRISEQLRIEKQLFPKCIQAPIKYENKRRSTNLTFVNKENRYSNYFPGEAISTSEEYKMENNINYVQQWLNKNEKNLARKPFSDLNVNAQQIISPKNKAIKQNQNENVSLAGNRKRSHFKTTDRDYSRLGGNRKSINEYRTTPKKVKKEPILSHLGNIQKCENDESGIFMENDPIIIDDSQESVLDKDKNAWLAVIKACENEDLTSTSLDNCSQANNDISINYEFNKKVKDSDKFEVRDNQVLRVPFYKRSAIMETCKYCKNEMYAAKPVPVTNPTKPVKITIDNDNFLTTITVFKNVQNNIVMNTSNNVSIQTDSCVTNTVDKDISKTNNIECSNKMSIEKDLTQNQSKCSSDKESIDLFADDRKIFGDIYQKPEVVIEESDSDSDLDASGPISVKVDVHRSYQDIECGILNEVANISEHENKPRRGPRGHTPTSTDSSEKENYNPNRIKRRIAGKKKYIKK